MIDAAPHIRLENILCIEKNESRKQECFRDFTWVSQQFCSAYALKHHSAAEMAAVFIFMPEEPICRAQPSGMDLSVMIMLISSRVVAAVKPTLSNLVWSQRKMALFEHFIMVFFISASSSLESIMPLPGEKPLQEKKTLSA